MKLFDTVKANKQRRTSFNMSHDKKLSCKFGQLIPILNEEVVPGDTWNCQTELMIRLAPMKAPVMHRINAYVHYFFVPNRIIWSDWEDFITGEQDYKIPTVTFGNGVAKGTLADYMGLPIMTAAQGAGNPVNVLPFRAYSAIYNEYYRDQNLIDKLDLTSNPQVTPIRYRAWEKDYFTSMLPEAQFGTESKAPLTVFPTYRPITEAYTEAGDPGQGDVFADQGEIEFGTGNDKGRLENLMSSLNGVIDINDFRVAHRVQKWLERQARAGRRYRETLLSHFGVRNNDARMQVPEYLGGGVTPITISEVLNTNGNQSGDQGAVNQPQGAMSGHGISVGQTNYTKNYFSEHGWVIGIMSILPKTAYQDGIHKSWIREDKYDFFWPEFANLGEQEVLGKELCVADDDTYWSETIGYQSRYADYKYKSSSVHGDFRENLNFWHAGRTFDRSDEPNLNEEFVTCNPDDIAQRIFATAEEDYLWCHLYHKITAKRPMPYYGTPTI